MSDRFDNIRIKPEPDDESPELREPDNLPEAEGTSSPAVADEPLDKDIFSGKKSLNGRKRKTRKAGGKSYRPWKGLMWACLPFIIVILYIVGSYLLVPVLIKGPAAGRVSDALNRTVSVDRVIFSPFTLRFILQDVVIGGLSGEGQDSLQLECSRMRGRFGLRRIWQRQLVIHQAQIDDFLLKMQRPENGPLNMGELVRFLSPPREENRLPLWPDWLVLNGIDIFDGTILIDDPGKKVQHRIEKIKVYLPAANNGHAVRSDLPSLRAVFNSSPVQIDGHRARNMNGELETRFTFGLGRIVLANYLDYLPLSLNTGLAFSEGEADVKLSLVIPEKSTSRNIQLTGTVKLQGIRIVDAGKNTVLRSSGAYADFNFRPAAGKLHLNRIVFDSPVLNLAESEMTEAEDRGLALEKLAAGLRWYGSLDSTVSCDLLQWKNGTISFLPDDNGSSPLTWTNVAFSLEGDPGYKHEKSVTAGKKIASFLMSGQDKNDETVTKFRVNGTIFSGLSVTGELTAQDFDLKKYAFFMPRPIRFDAGRGFFIGKYEYVDSGGRLKAFNVHDGQFTAKQYTMIGRGDEKVAGGRQLLCSELAADWKKKSLLCGLTEIDASELNSEAVRVLNQKNGVESGSWKVAADALQVRESTLIANLSNPLNGKEKLQFKIEKFTLNAVDLGSRKPAGENVKVSGMFSEGGTLKCSGMYSLAEDRGLIDVQLTDGGPDLLKPFFSPWFVPVMRTCSVNVKGKYLIHEKQFDGMVIVENFVAGHRKQSYVSFDKAMAETVHLEQSPYRLTVGDIVLENLVIVPGISNAGKTVEMFFRVPAIAPEKPVVKINTARLSNGRYHLAEPVLFPGYQPEISGISGTVSSIGKEFDAISYSLDGLMDKKTAFRVTGTADMDGLSSYSVNVTDFPLNRYGRDFAEKAGLGVRQGNGNWHQVMLKEGGTRSVSTRIFLDNIRPDLASEYAGIASLYIDKNNALRIDTKAIVADGEEKPFLFQSVIRYLQRDAVKSEISRRLVLERMFPALQLEEKIAFAPGTTVLSTPASIEAYRELLRERPHLQLVFRGAVDPVSDKAALQEILQEEQDEKRNAENRRRQQEREKVLQRQRERLAAMQDRQGSVVEETIPSWEVYNLQPLADIHVEVSEEMLAELARKRAETLRQYCVHQLFFSPGRVVISDKTDSNGPFVLVEIQPFLNQSITLETLEYEEENDTKPGRENENSEAF